MIIKSGSIVKGLAFFIAIVVSFSILVGAGCVVLAQEEKKEFNAHQFLENIKNSQEAQEEWMPSCQGCLGIVELKITPAIVPAGMITVNNCNNGVLIVNDVCRGNECFVKSNHALKVGVLALDSQDSFELCKDEAGKIYARRVSEYRALSTAPINETLSVAGKYDGKDFVLSYKRIVLKQSNCRMPRGMENR